MSGEILCCFAVAVTACLLFGSVSPGAEPEHPTLLVRKSMYADMRAKAKEGVWKDIADRAVQHATSTLRKRNRFAWGRMATRMGAASLAHILDPGNGSAYRRVVLGFIREAPIPSGAPDWSVQVPPGIFAMEAIVALDVMHDDLPPDELQAAEEKLSRLIEMVNRGWVWNWISVHAAWALYNGDVGAAKKLKEQYDQAWDACRTADGVWSEGPGYASARFAWLRVSKFYLMDIAGSNGLGSYYDDPEMSRFYEWLYGYGRNPAGGLWVIGDSPANGHLSGHTGGSAPYNIHKFSELAVAYAAYRYRKNPPAPAATLHGFLTYAPLPEPKSPPSRIFPDGGAFFQETPLKWESLAGLLWNCTIRGWHTHSDVNAINAYAYGENILIGTGYPGPNAGRYNFDWNYISHTAAANNTVTIDGRNHVIGQFISVDGGDYDSQNGGWDSELTSKRGAGIREGFTSEGLDYACGDSGKVVPNGRHLRNFLMIHPQDEAAGYFVLLDEVVADSPAALADLHLHPNSRAVAAELVAEANALEEKHAHENLEQNKKGHVPLTVVEKGRHYRWPINGGVLFNRGKDVSVDVFLGLAPTKVDLRLGVRTAWGTHRWSTLGSGLHASFPTDKAGKVNIPTVIYPSDSAHPPAEIARIRGDGYCGVKLGAGAGLTDYVLAMPLGAGQPVQVDGLVVRARSAVFRKADSGPIFYFVRKGTRFQAGGVGFESDKPVTIHVRGKVGRVVSPGATVTIRRRGETATLKLDEGTHELRL